MAKYIDLPEEINREVLFKQNPSNIIHHCNVNKNTRKICDSVTFWVNYLKGMKRYEIQKFVMDSIRQSQDFIVPIYKAANKIIQLTPLINDTIFFYSIMRNDTATMAYFAPFYQNKINYKQVVIVTNKIIDMINSGHATAEALGDLYIKLGKELSGVKINTLPILDQLKIGAISRLPAILMIRYINNIAINKYEWFMIYIISNLAVDGNTRDLINIIQKSYDNEARLAFLYSVIANYLPSDLFSYLQSKLPQKVILGEYINEVTDLDHARYLLSHPEFIKGGNMIDITEFIDPDEFVNAMYTSNSTYGGEELVKRMIARNIPTPMDEAGNIEWAKEVERKWKQITNQK